MNVGFTGTRQGCAPEQLKSLELLLKLLKPTEFHHGAAIGADAQAAKIAASIDGCQIIAWPGCNLAGESPDMDATSLEISHVKMRQAGYFTRNRKIVSVCDVLVACPPCHPLPSTGGTAYTIRHAVKMSVPVLIVWPDGLIRSAGD